jgi:hypothetical protein
MGQFMARTLRRAGHPVIAARGGGTLTTGIHRRTRDDIKSDGVRYRLCQQQASTCLSPGLMAGQPCAYSCHAPLWLLVNNPVAAIIAGLEGQVGNKLLEVFDTARE